MSVFQFHVSITAKEFERYYRGTGTTTTVMLTDGRTLSLPTKLLTKHITHDGIYGDFELTTNQSHPSILKRL